MRKFSISLLVVIGVIAAGSDGKYFPFVNAVGLAFIYIATCMVQSNEERRSDGINRY